MTKNRIPVDQLEGVELDLWVARATLNEEDFKDWLWKRDNMPLREIYIDYNFVGPIIERDKITCYLTEKTNYYYWTAMLGDDGVYAESETTALEAIKRCIVKNKYGEHVEE